MAEAHEVHVKLDMSGEPLKRGSLDLARQRLAVPSGLGRSESQAKFETENAGMRITFKVRERPRYDRSLWAERWSSSGQPVWQLLHWCSTACCAIHLRILRQSARNLAPWQRLQALSRAPSPRELSCGQEGFAPPASRPSFSSADAPVRPIGPLLLGAV